MYRLTDEGAFLMLPVDGKRARQVPTVDCWRALQLSPSEARRLAADWDACLKAAAERSRGTTRAYLAHFACAPRLKPSSHDAFSQARK